jgi:hypothetical protein
VSVSLKAAFFVLRHFMVRMMCAVDSLQYAVGVGLAACGVLAVCCVVCVAWCGTFAV